MLSFSFRDSNRPTYDLSISLIGSVLAGITLYERIHLYFKKHNIAENNSTCTTLFIYSLHMYGTPPVDVYICRSAPCLCPTHTPHPLVPLCLLRWLMSTIISTPGEHGQLHTCMQTRSHCIRLASFRLCNVFASSLYLSAVDSDIEPQAAEEINAMGKGWGGSSSRFCEGLWG